MCCSTDSTVARWGFYGISTEDRPERIEHLEREFARAGLPLTVHRSIRPSDPGGFASTGVRGCFESHLHCLKAARADGVEVAVLVEDDVVVTRRFRSSVIQVADELADLEWSVLYLGYLGSSPARESALSLVTPHIAAADGWEITGTHCLAISRGALGAAIEDFEARLAPGGHRIPADGVYNEFRRSTSAPTLVCVPNLANQAPSRSGIMPGVGLKHRVLGIASARRAALVIKRRAWDLESRVPPQLAVRVWNLRARRLARRMTSRHPGDGGG